jgi:hypothetical protein
MSEPGFVVPLVLLTSAGVIVAASRLSGWRLVVEPLRDHGRLRRLPVGVALLLVALPRLAASAEVEPALSAEVGSPLKLSASLGVRVGTVGQGDADYGRGFLIQVQPGLGGGALNVGWAPVALPAWGTQAVGVAIKARLLRTWGDPWGGLRPAETFAGGEVAVAWIVKVSFGVLTRVGSGEGKKTILTWSVGLGL